MNVRRISTVEFRDRLSQIVNEAAFGNKATIIERHGKELAVLMPITAATDMLRVQAGIVSTVSGPTVVEPGSVLSVTNHLDGG